MRGAVIGLIIASKSSSFPVGAYASSDVGWTEIAVVNEKKLQKIDVPKNGRVTDTLGVLGKNPPNPPDGYRIWVITDLRTYNYQA